MILPAITATLGAMRFANFSATRTAPVTSRIYRQSNLPSERLFLRLFLADLFHHKCLYPAEFLLEPVGEIVRAVFEKNDKTEGEKNEESDPEYAAQQSHGRNPN